MADDSIFSKVEATLSNDWIKNYGSDVTELLSAIENATNKNIEIRFRNGRYTIRGSLLHINAVHGLLFTKDVHPHLQLEFTDGYMMSGPPSFFYPNAAHEALYVRRESNIEESELEFVTTYTDGTAGKKSCGWQSENSVSDASEKSEAMQRSSCTESCNAEMHDKSANASDTVAGDRGIKEEIRDVKMVEIGPEMNCTTASDTSGNVDMNDRSSDTSNSVAVGIDKNYKGGISTDDGDQIIDTNDKCDVITNDGKLTINTNSDEDNSKVTQEANKELENHIFSDQHIVDPEVWDYMLGIKIHQLSEVLEPFGASYKSEWDSANDVYKVHLVIQNLSPNDNSQKSITLACEQFDRLYKETFASCEVVQMNYKYFADSLAVNHMRTEFPSVLPKHSAESVLLIGPKLDVQKAKKYLVSNHKTALRRHKSSSACSSVFSMDLTQSGEASKPRLCQSAIFAANDSLTSAEESESLTDKVDDLKLRPPLTDELKEKDEKTSSQLVSASTNRDGCGDCFTTAGFEHLDSDNLQEKDSSTESFSILHSSPSSSFDDAFVSQK